MRVHTEWLLSLFLLAKENPETKGLVHIYFKYSYLIYDLNQWFSREKNTLIRQATCLCGRYSLQFTLISSCLPEYQSIQDSRKYIGCSTSQ